MDGRKIYNPFGLCRNGSIFAVVLCLTLAFTLPALAKTFHCGAGDAACLIAAINTANANGHKNTIELEAGVYTLTAADNVTPGPNGQDGPNGLPSITSTLTIKGAGADATGIARPLSSSPPFFRLMHVAASGNLTLQGVKLSGGFCVCNGAGLYNDGGAVTVTDSVFTQNGGLGTGGLASTAGTVNLEGSRFSFNGGNLGGPGGLSLYGGTASITKSTFDHNGLGTAGAIDLCGGCFGANAGTLTMTDSAITDNHCFLCTAGGIAIRNGFTVEISNSTFARNGGGLDDALAIFNGGTLHLDNVTLADNIDTSGRDLLRGTPTLWTEAGATTTIENSILALTSSLTTQDCSGVITSLGYNLIANPAGCNINLQLSDLVGDPGLDTFQDNGQPGNGHFPLLPSSRAIDTGAAQCPKWDQIGQRRIKECDTGAIAFRDFL
jgi:hypothetical protein